MKQIIVSLLVFLSVFAGVAEAKPKRIPAREVKERALPRLAVNALGVLVPVVHAGAVVVYDPATMQVLYGENADVVRSIASITKIMTASVVLEDMPDLTQPVVIQPSDTNAANHTYLRRGDRVTVGDLLHLMLIASDNAAARALARVSPFGPVGFIQRMNLKALELGLLSTRYADSSGLLAGNLSTALDMAKLITLVSENETITGIMQKPGGIVQTAKRTIKFNTTDHLLTHPDVPVVAAKTGYTNPAGFCLATLLRLPTDEQVAIIVLGARSNADRFIEAENLFKWMVVRPPEPMPSSEHVSPAGLEWIKSVESFVPTPRKDSKGWFVGYGFHTWNGRAVTPRYPRLVTRDEADAELETQMARFEPKVPAVPTQGAFDALVSVAYNVGHVNPTIMDKLTNGQPVTPDDFLSTATIKNRRFAPLEDRRMREFSIFAGDYDGLLVGRTK